jgi:hypothetical protein
MFTTVAENLNPLLADYIYIGGGLLTLLVVVLVVLLLFRR